MIQYTMRQRQIIKITVAGFDFSDQISKPIRIKYVKVFFTPNIPHGTTFEFKHGKLG